MDALTTTGLIMLGLTGAGLLTALGLGGLTIYARLAARHRCKALGRDLAHLVAEHEARPRQRHRHAARCPSCGRFARVTSTGPRGTFTRCAAHGVRLRATRRVGRVERTLVEVTTHESWLDESHPVTPPLGIELPVRGRDWLDGERVATLRELLAA